MLSNEEKVLVVESLENYVDTLRELTSYYPSKFDSNPSYRVAMKQDVQKLVKIKELLEKMR